MSVVSGSLPATAKPPVSPSPRPGDGTSRELSRVGPAPNGLSPWRYAAAAAAGSLPQTNSVSSAQIRVQHGGKLTRQCHFCPPHAPPLGDVERALSR